MSLPELLKELDYYFNIILRNRLTYHDNFIISEYNNRIHLTSKTNELVRVLSNNNKVKDEISEQVKSILSKYDVQYSSISFIKMQTQMGY